MSPLTLSWHCLGTGLTPCDATGTGPASNTEAAKHTEAAGHGTVVKGTP